MSKLAVQRAKPNAPASPSPPKVEPTASTGQKAEKGPEAAQSQGESDAGGFGGGADESDSASVTVAAVVVDQDAGYDTDLAEPEPPEMDHAQEMAAMYRRACRFFNVVPSDYFIRHMLDTKLNMSHHLLGNGCFRPIAVILVSNTEIEEADFSDNWLEPKGAHYVGEILKENYFITVLNLSNNQLGYSGAKAICEALIENGYLQNLNLSGNGFKSDTVPFFDDVLRSSGTGLQSLDLSHNEFCEKNSLKLGLGISENVTLEHLNLSWNLFSGKRAIAHIMFGIKNNVRLKVLEFSHNGIGEEGSKSVADMLKVNSMLTELDISNCRIPSQGAFDMAVFGLAHNETLQVLNISHNPIGVEGSRALIVRGLTNEKSVVHTLDLSGVVIDKKFLEVKKHLDLAKDVVIIHGTPISNYVIKGIYKKRVLFPHRPFDVTSENVFQLCANFAAQHKLRLTLQIDKMLKTQPKEKLPKMKKMKLVPCRDYLDMLVESGFILTPEQTDAVLAALEAQKFDETRVDIRPIMPLLKPNV